ncbi:MAG: RnfABCDGE type electron transport complex subunit A [Lachnospiraceae bacterium]|nr:RnfABCDGE type electron transport complex subunit A [Lachnospiraceae bacterium]
MTFGSIMSILIMSMLINNVVLSQFLGICPFLGVSKKVDTASGMGGAVIFVIGIASAIAALIYKFILLPFGLTYLNTIVFILVIAALVQFVEMFLKKSMPGLYKALGVYLPLITTNCAVLGVVLLNVQNSYNFVESVVNGLATAAGFAISIVILAGLREKMKYNNIPRSFQGMPIVMFTSGLMAIAFCGFSGLK